MDRFVNIHLNTIIARRVEDLGPTDSPACMAPAAQIRRDSRAGLAAAAPARATTRAWHSRWQSTSGIESSAMAGSPQCLIGSEPIQSP